MVLDEDYTIFYHEKNVKKIRLKGKHNNEKRNI